MPSSGPPPLRMDERQRRPQHGRGRFSRHRPQPPSRDRARIQHLLEERHRAHVMVAELAEKPVRGGVRPRPRATSTWSLQAVKSCAPSPRPRASVARKTSIPQDERTSREPHHSRTGMDAYWPSSRPSSRATQISGRPSARAGFSRYCHCHRRRLASVRDAPNTSPYMRKSSSASDAPRCSMDRSGAFPPWQNAKATMGKSAGPKSWPHRDAPRRRVLRSKSRAFILEPPHPSPRRGLGRRGRPFRGRPGAPQPLFVNVGAGDAPFARGCGRAGSATGSPGSGETMFRWAEDGSRLGAALLRRLRPA